MVSLVLIPDSDIEILRREFNFFKENHSFFEILPILVELVRPLVKEGQTLDTSQSNLQTFLSFLSRANNLYSRQGGGREQGLKLCKLWVPAFWIDFPKFVFEIENMVSYSAEIKIVDITDQVHQIEGILPHLQLLETVLNRIDIYSLSSFTQRTKFEYNGLRFTFESIIGTLRHWEVRRIRGQHNREFTFSSIINWAVEENKTVREVVEELNQKLFQILEIFVKLPQLEKYWKNKKKRTITVHTVYSEAYFAGFNFNLSRSLEDFVVILSLINLKNSVPSYVANSILHEFTHSRYNVRRRPGVSFFRETHNEGLASFAQYIEGNWDFYDYFKDVLEVRPITKKRIESWDHYYRRELGRLMVIQIFLEIFGARRRIKNAILDNNVEEVQRFVQQKVQDATNLITILQKIEPKAFFVLYFRKVGRRSVFDDKFKKETIQLAREEGVYPVDLLNERWYKSLIRRIKFRKF